MITARKLAILTSLTCSAVASFAVVPAASKPAGSEAQASATAVARPQSAVHKYGDLKSLSVDDFDATDAASPISPRPKKTCTIINGVSAYLGCEVKDGATTTTYYNCKNNPPPCMDEAACRSCTVPGGN